MSRARFAETKNYFTHSRIVGSGFRLASLAGNWVMGSRDAGVGRGVDHIPKFGLFGLGWREGRGPSVTFSKLFSRDHMVLTVGTH